MEAVQVAATTTTVSDVATGLGRPISEGTETAQVTSWIERVEARVRDRIADVDARLTDPTYMVRYKGVVVDVVIRRILNPTGVKSEQIDDYRYDLGASHAAADLWPTADEWNELGAPSSGGAFSIRPRYEGDQRETVWYPL